MTVSIIIPIYNAEKYIRKCLDCIVKQTYRDLEIILIDDGSTDLSSQICDEYAAIDNRITVIHQKNSGQSVARNSGLDIASGEYIGFVDADDSIKLDMFEKMVNAIIYTDIVICNYDLVDYNGKIRTNNITKTVCLTNDDLWKEILIHLNNAVWNKLYKRSLIKDIRFDSQLHHGEDMIFNLEYISNCTGGVYISESLYNYHKNSYSVTSSQFSKRKFSEITSKDIMRDIIQKNKKCYIREANLLCYKARMNVVKSIYNSNFEKDYSLEINKILNDLKIVKKDVAKLLSKKDKIEYILFENNKFLFKVYTKIYYLIRRKKL